MVNGKEFSYTAKGKAAAKKAVAAKLKKKKAATPNRIITGGKASSLPQTTMTLPKPLTMIGKAETAKARTTGGTGKASEKKKPIKIPVIGKPTGTVNKEKMKKAAPVKAAAKKTSYAGNIIKEVKQTAKRVSNAVDKMDKKAYEARYGRKLPAVGSSRIKSQVGQLAGAILQGRRYDDKTNKQIMPKTARKTVKKIMK